MPSDTRARCSDTDTVDVHGDLIELRCVHWGDGGRHAGDHLVHTPAVHDDRTWTNTDPLDESA